MVKRAHAITHIDQFPHSLPFRDSHGNHGNHGNDGNHGNRHEKLDGSSKTDLEMIAKGRLVEPEPPGRREPATWTAVG